MIKKIILLILMFSVSIFSIVFAETKKWEFDNELNYVVQDDSEVEISSGVVKLIKHINDPVHKSSIINDNTTALNGSWNIVVSGNYAYVTSYVDDGVEVLDISDPTNPVHVTSVVDDAVMELNGAMGIAISGHYLYIASLVDDGVEILDISDPANPVHAGSITDGGDMELNGATDISVSGDYAYITGYIDDGMEVLDISDPTNPIHAGSITDNGNTELDGARNIFVLGNYAYIASYADDGVEILDISDPTNPIHAGSITDNSDTLLDGAWDIVVLDSYAYITGYTENGIEILNISDPTNPTHVNSVVDSGEMELRGSRGITSSGDYIYIVGYVDDGVEILDISDPTNPVHTGSINNDVITKLDGATGIFISGHYAYVSSYLDDSVEVLDVSQYSPIKSYVENVNTEHFLRNIINFSGIVTENSQGEVFYQLSSDGGLNWKFWNGLAWKITTKTDGTEVNNISDVNSNINLFDIDGGNFKWRAYLSSDGIQKVELDEVSVNWNNAPVISGHSGKNISKAGGSKSSKKVCKDSRALNFNNIGQHEESLCEYPWLKKRKDLKSNLITGGKKCSSSQILTQNITLGSWDGRRHWYTGGIVKEVKILQAHMNRLGFRSGKEDGIFGPITLGAIKRMQKFLGTFQDGMVGPITRKLINNSCRK